MFPHKLLMALQNVLVSTSTRNYLYYSLLFPLVSHFCLTKNLTIVTVEGEVYTGPVTTTPSLLSLTRVPLIQQAKKVFTDYKTTNLAVLQNVYRYYYNMYIIYIYIHIIIIIIIIITCFLARLHCH